MSSFFPFFHPSFRLTYILTYLSIYIPTCLLIFLSIYLIYLTNSLSSFIQCFQCQWVNNLYASWTLYLRAFILYLCVVPCGYLLCAWGQTSAHRYHRWMVCLLHVLRDVFVEHFSAQSLYGTHLSGNWMKLAILG